MCKKALIYRPPNEEGLLYKLNALGLKDRKISGELGGKEDALRPNQIVCIGIMDKVIYGNH